MNNTLKGALDEIAECCLDEKDSVFTISGYNGRGKSSLALTQGLYLAKRLGLEFSLPKNMIFEATEEQIRDAFYRDKLSPLIFDEALLMANKHAWFSKLALYLEKLFTVNRSQNHPVALLGPRPILDLTENFRNQRVTVDFRILTRGIGVILIRHPDPGIRDPWFVAETEKVILKNPNYIFESVGHWVDAYSRLPNFIGHFTWEDLAKTRPALWRDYQELSEAKKEESLRVVEKEKTKRVENLEFRDVKFSIVRSLLGEGRTRKEISEMTSLTPSVVNRIAHDLYLEDLNAQKSQPAIPLVV